MSTLTSFLIDDAFDLYYKRLYYPAIEAFLETKKMSPTNSLILIGLGLCFDSIGHHEQAVDYFTRAITLNPSSGYFYYYRAKSAAMVNNRAEFAVKDAKKAVNLLFPYLNAEELICFANRDEKERIKKIGGSILRSGFYLSIKGNENIIFLMPRLSTYRIILKPGKLRINKTKQRLMKNRGDDYKLKFISDFDYIFERCKNYHKDTGINNVMFMKDLYYLFSLMNGKEDAPRAVCTALYNKNTNKIAAGDIGVIIGKVFSSYTAFYEKEESDSGNILFIKLARFLEDKYSFWDLGPDCTPQIENYKLNYNAEIRYYTPQFLRMFNSEDE